MKEQDVIESHLIVGTGTGMWDGCTYHVAQCQCGHQSKDWLVDDMIEKHVLHQTDMLVEFYLNTPTP